jgi:hypothetical protein
LMPVIVAGPSFLVSVEYRTYLQRSQKVQMDRTRW